MKIATYNLRFGGKASNRIHWQKVLNKINPDIFLVQETLPPAQYLSADFYQNSEQQFHWHAVEGRLWGSAVYVRSGQVVPLPPLSAELAGWVSGIKVIGFGWAIPEGQSLYIYSVHAPSVGSSYVKQVNLILDAIGAQVPSEAMVIIGGDFNLTVGYRHPSEELQQTRRKLMTRFKKEHGLMSCWQLANPNRDLPQTLRWSKDKAPPFHCDGIFVPAGWYRYLEDSTVLSGPEWESLSDHNPVVGWFE